MTFESKLLLSQHLAPAKTIFLPSRGTGLLLGGMGRAGEMSPSDVLLLMVSRGKGGSAEPPRMGLSSQHGAENPPEPLPSPDHKLGPDLKKKTLLRSKNKGNRLRSLPPRFPAGSLQVCFVFFSLLGKHPHLCFKINTFPAAGDVKKWRNTTKKTPVPAGDVAALASSPKGLFSKRIF